MKNFKVWLGVSALSLALMGCGTAGNQSSGGATTKSTGMSNYQTNNYNANANVNDTNPRTYGTNSLYKANNWGMGVRGVGNNTSTTNASFGYATYNKTDMHAQQASTFYVDRNVLARAVATVVNSVPGIDNSTVLVTDEDIFVGVGGAKDNSTLNKAKLATWSMSPRYYKVHVTSDQNTINQVKTLVGNSNNRQPIDEAKLESILKNKTIDMTGTNVTDNKQNNTNYNLNQTYPHTNGTNKMR